jgi:hypothetical protein
MGTASRREVLCKSRLVQTKRFNRVTTLTCNFFCLTGRDGRKVARVDARQSCCAVVKFKVESRSQHRFFRKKILIIWANLSWQFDLMLNVCNQYARNVWVERRRAVAVTLGYGDDYDVIDCL